MRVRLDQLLVMSSLAESREKAKAAIMAGIVYVNGQKATKAGMQVDQDAEIEVRGKALPYVSQVGLKLEKALEVFGVDPSGWVAVDVGASTGGFTDCLLQNGARRAYAVDVGYGQLDWKLRGDPRVVVMERTNIRHVDPASFPEKADLAVIDVSFISLVKIFGVVLSLLKDDGQVIALIKPSVRSREGTCGKKRCRARPCRAPPGPAEPQCGAAGVWRRSNRVGLSPVTGPGGQHRIPGSFPKGYPAQSLAEECTGVVERAWQELTP